MIIPEVTIVADAATSIAQTFTAAAQAFSTWKSAHKGQDVSPEAKELTLRLSELFERHAGLIDAHMKLNAAYANQLAINASIEQRISELTKEVADLKAFDADAKKYKLVQIGPGAGCYIPKPYAKTFEEGPYLCKACFGQSKKAYLNRVEVAARFDRYRCELCKAEILKPNNNKPAGVTIPPTAPVRGSSRRRSLDGF